MVMESCFFFLYSYLTKGKVKPYSCIKYVCIQIDNKKSFHYITGDVNSGIMSLRLVQLSHYCPSLVLTSRQTHSEQPENQNRR